MAVSKRTRFEVLRRDNYTCRYCRSTESNLRIDHVTPVAIGGTDDPSNLVACCQDCNAGKASTLPDAETVAQVTEDALRWARAMDAAQRIEAEKRAGGGQSSEWFRELWRSSTGAALPANWPSSIGTFSANGLTEEALRHAVAKASERTATIEPESLFRYFCGICWSMIRELRAIAERVLAEEPTKRA